MEQIVIFSGTVPSGDTVIVPSPGPFSRIIVTSGTLSTLNAGNFHLRSGIGGVPISGLLYLPARGTHTWPWAKTGWCMTLPGQPLVLNTPASETIGITLAWTDA